MATKPFEKEAELARLKSELSKLEREIRLKIQEGQMKQNGLFQEQPIGETAVEPKMIQLRPGEKITSNDAVPLITKVALMPLEQNKRSRAYKQQL